MNTRESIEKWIDAGYTKDRKNYPPVGDNYEIVPVGTPREIDDEAYVSVDKRWYYVVRAVSVGTKVLPDSFLTRRKKKFSQPTEEKHRCGRMKDAGKSCLFCGGM